MPVNYSSAKVEVVPTDVTTQIGEGPHWEEDTGRLLFVDIPTGKLYRWHGASGKLETKEFEEPATFIVPREKGGYLVGLGRKIVALDWDTQEITTLTEVEKKGLGNRMNDGKCDPAGRLWAGSMGPYDPSKGIMDLGMGVLGCLDTKGVWRQYRDSVDISNGLAWTKDTETMFYIDTHPRKVYAFDFNNENGTISNERVLADFSPEPMDVLGYPDGCCIDVNDNLWVACFGPNKVVHIDTKTGTKLGEIRLPAQNITSCCFGGPTYEDLYVTSARHGVSEEQLRTTQPLHGSIFKVTGLGVKGLPGAVYRG